MRRVAVVGGGQAGAQLALGLLAAGYQVTLVSNRTPAELREGRVLSSQCMFASALEAERVLGLDRWQDECPPVEGISFAVPDGAGGTAVAWAARLDAPARSVDQRLKVAWWLEQVDAAEGGRLVIEEATPADLQRYAREHDLVVVATGKGDLARLFRPDREKSPYDRPQRALALTYVVGMEPRPEFSAVCFNLIPEVGEYFVFPALTTTGPCEIMVFEGIPGGPMDRWDDVRTPGQHLARSLELLERFLPWEAERCRDVELTDPNGILTGRFAPTVRRPVAELDGVAVLGMADAVVLNDPITGQGSNNAAKCAETYLEAILEREDEPFDADWMQHTFDRYWRGYAQWVTQWTNALLAPPKPHVLGLLGAAQELPSLARTIANGFDDPRVYFPWWFVPDEAERLIEAHRRESAEARFDRRDLRQALGQFATGVTVVTTLAPDGRRVGLTANSFTSLSLEPPLLLFCLDRRAPSLPAFVDSSHFAVNVLAADQHHLSRQFAMPAEDKFAGVDVVDGPGGVPLLEGVLARFTCRHVEHYEGGDHLIFIGEIEEYDSAGGEPLVFHSGFYRVATRHPELDAAG